jgi:DNA-binding CsgD family transcriptional regulator
MELLERAEALGTLTELLSESASGGRIALLPGEAGAGKSAVVTAFARGLGPRATVLWGACDPLLTPRALGPLHDIAHQLGGAFADRLAAGRREALFAALIDALAGPRQRPRTVVVMEDLHWADEATLDLLTFLGRRLARCRALVVLTYRDDELAPDGPLHAVLAGLPRAGTRRLPLPPLSTAAVTELAHRAGRPAAEVERVTGGNPLLVTEVLAAAEPGVPPTVQDLVRARLARLSPAARAVAGLVSVVPSRAESALLAPGDVEAVEECLAQGVLVAVADAVAFRHELLRRAVEEGLSPPRRAAAHARVLAALADRPDVDPARLVHHAHHAGDPAAVLRWAPVAARRAAAVGAHRQAAAHYAAALAPAVDLPAADRAELLEAYSFSGYLAGLTGEAFDARRRALALRELDGDPDRIGANLRWLSRLAWWTGRTAEARSAAARAVEVLRAAPAGRQLAMAYSNVSQLHMLANEDAEAIDWGGRALALSRRLGDRETETHALVNVGSARLQRGDPGGADDLERAHELAVAAGLADHAARALVNLASLAVEWAEFDSAAAVLERALRFTTERDLDGYARHLLGHRASVRLARGDWAGAGSDAQRALAGPEQPGASLVRALVVLGRLQARRGDPAALPTLRSAARRAAETGELQFVGPSAAALAEYHWLAGDPAAAVAAADQGFGLAVRSGNPWYAGELGYWRWRAGERGAGPELAAAPYRLLIAGDWAGAAAEWAARGCPYSRAEALGCGDAAAAGEALRIMDGLGARRSARRLRADLRARGIVGVPRGPRPPAAANPFGLTARQLEVAALLADGLSNTAIATRLSLSAKTVEHHVSAVLAKLGVPNRGQAAAAVRRSGAVPPT